MARASKGDYISIQGLDPDVNTTEVLAIHREPGSLTWEAKGDFGPGPILTMPHEYYLTEYAQGQFDLVSEHDVTKVYKGH